MPSPRPLFLNKIRKSGREFKADALVGSSTNSDYGVGVCVGVDRYIFMETKRKDAFIYLKIETENFMSAVLDNLERRLRQHKNGHTQTTKKMDNFEIILKQEYGSLNLARKIELKIKN